MENGMKSLELTQFLGLTTGMFFRPFKTLSEVFLSIREIGRGNAFRLALAAFLFGNVSMNLAGILMGSSGMWEGGVFLVFHLLFQVLSSFLYNIVLIAFFYLLIWFFSRQETVLPEIDKLICLYFVPDILFSALLPVSLILSAFGNALDPVFRLFGFVITLLVILMKIRALSLIASISKGKSTALFLAPILIFAVFAITGVIYTAVYLSRMFS
jgi:hypothetical protein